jgi:hypothetical protein
MNVTKNWLTAPALPFMLFVLAIWLIGTACSLLAMTNLLTETPFQSRYVVQWFLVFSSSATVLWMTKNYLKNVKK